ncbi:hypothetical protein [Dyella acidiphila]|uniref:Uncharacterized protein n=1 Tax=Dyella acidiphila TaxID=2775866 RepID=A0ABR9GG19_9GAMM|nr:hypothetical protein [Dyella acidiphila]MBE1162989.1 hypothetical protein [Dyella acidiphila]
MMNFYARLLVAEKPETYSQAEVNELCSTIASAPGVEEITRVAKHFKGGYDVAVQLTDGSEGPFLDYLWKAGYRPSI